MSAASSCSQDKKYLPADGPWEGHELALEFEDRELNSIRFLSSAIDHRNKRIVAFGCQESNGDLNDKWIWNGQDWKNVNDEENKSMTRNFGKMAYTKDGILLIGVSHSIENDFIDLDGTWIFNK